MTLLTTYPPHPAEGRRLSPFTTTADAVPSAWPPPAAPPAAAAPTATAGLPAPDRRQHWLAYDPSSRSQYPVD